MSNEKLGVIEKIRVYPAKGEKGKEPVEARLIENLGVEGDCYAKGGDRQITLMFTNDEDGNKTAEKGLCAARFKENITIKRFPTSAGDRPPFLSSGTHLAIGEALLEISGETKHCHEECPLFQAGKRCSLAGLNLFARVLKSGIVHVGDRIDLTEPIGTGKSTI